MLKLLSFINPKYIAAIALVIGLFFVHREYVNTKVENALLIQLEEYNAAQLKLREELQKEFDDKLLEIEEVFDDERSALEENLVEQEIIERRIRIENSRLKNSESTDIIKNTIRGIQESQQRGLNSDE